MRLVLLIILVIDLQQLCQPVVEMKVKLIIYELPILLVQAYSQLTFFFLFLVINVTNYCLILLTFQSLEINSYQLANDRQATRLLRHFWDAEPS